MRLVKRPGVEREVPIMDALRAVGLAWIVAAPTVASAQTTAPSPLPPIRLPGIAYPAPAEARTEPSAPALKPHGPTPRPASTVLQVRRLARVRLPRDPALRVYRNAGRQGRRGARHCPGPPAGRGPERPDLLIKDPRRKRRGMHPKGFTSEPMAILPDLWD